MVYQREDELVTPLLPAADTADDSVAGMVTESREAGLLPRTELPKLAVKSPLDPPYACSM